MFSKSSHQYVFLSNGQEWISVEAITVKNHVLLSNLSSRIRFCSHIIIPQEESYPVLSESPMNSLKEMGNQIILNFKTKQYFINIAKMRQNAIWCKRIKSAKTNYLWDSLMSMVMSQLGNWLAKNNLLIKLKPRVYGLSWCSLPFPRTPIRKLRGFKGFYFI